MKIKDILSKIDHTCLSPTATWEDIKTLCDDAIAYGCASVCIPPSFVEKTKEYVGDKINICTVIGFPNGYNTKNIKWLETKNAIENGADEIDMVINIGLLKDKKYNDVLAEIKAIKNACGDRILKVIVETCLLTEEEKIKMCEIVSESGADFIKTSTGFSKNGATADDIELFVAHLTNGVKIKASGGINSLSLADYMINRGAERIGASKVVKDAKERGLKI